MNIEERMPDLTFFVVGIRGKRPRSFRRRMLFCSLENSLSIRSIMSAVGDLDLSYIELWNPAIDRPISSLVRMSGITFAETGKEYREKDLDELLEDYFIVKLSGVKQ